jgi:hypothetical protein
VDVHSLEPHPVPVPESLYIDGDHISDVMPWSPAPVDTHVSGDVAVIEEQLENIAVIAADLPEKNVMFSSDFEKVLKELVKG